MSQGGRNAAASDQKLDAVLLKPGPGTQTVRPVEVRLDQEITDMYQHRIVIHQQSSLVQTITDNTGSHIDTRSQMLDRNLNLTELERKVRQANGLDSQHTHS